MNEPLPELPPVRSITDDDDSHDEPSGRYSVPNESHDVDPRALAYLLRYETMMRHQEVEEMATLDHIRPLLERIQSLGSESSDDSTYSSDESRMMDHDISYAVLRRALGQLEGSSEVMTTDKQLMMVLRTISGGAQEGDETITLAELVQCYKTVVTGMQTLQHLPGESVVRSRARDRTLSIISLFSPASTKLLNEDGLAIKEDESIIVKPARSLENTQSKKKTGGFATVLLVATLLLLSAIAGMTLAPPSLLNSVSEYAGVSSQNEAASSPKPFVTRGSNLNDKQTFPSTIGHISHHMKSVPTTRSLKTTRVDQQDLRLLAKDNPSLGKAVRIRMVASAAAGGAAGALLSPAIWSAVRALVPKTVLSGLASAAPGLNPLVALSALVAGSVAVFHGGFHNNRRSRRGQSTQDGIKQNAE